MVPLDSVYLAYTKYKTCIKEKQREKVKSGNTWLKFNNVGKLNLLVVFLGVGTKFIHSNYTSLRSIRHIIM